MENIQIWQFLMQLSYLWEKFLCFLQWYIRNITIIYQTIQCTHMTIGGRIFAWHCFRITQRTELGIFGFYIVFVNLTGKKIKFRIKIMRRNKEWWTNLIFDLHLDYLTKHPVGSSIQNNWRSFQLQFRLVISFYSIRRHSLPWRFPVLNVLKIVHSIVHGDRNRDRDDNISILLNLSFDRYNSLLQWPPLQNRCYLGFMQFWNKIKCMNNEI